jgi:dGTPase
MAHHSRRCEHPAARDLFAAGEPTLEARVVDAADSLAYDTHDLDDSLGYGLLTLDELESVAFWRVGADRVRRESPGLGPQRFRKSVVRALIEWQVSDLLAHTRDRIRTERVESLADVRRAPDLVGNSEPARTAKAELEAFLTDRVYRHPRVRQMAEQGQRWIRAVFEVYLLSPQEMSDRFARRAQTEPAPQVVCDYV